MKKSLAILFSLIGWFAVVAQFVLMLENRENLLAESIIRFFSYFTILTNILVATNFTIIATSTYDQISLKNRNYAVLTATTVYIFIVGLVYQLVLRQLWHPEGLQMIVDELLHSVIPCLTILFWFLYEDKKALRYAHISKWMLYPLIYLVYILIRGNFSHFYPYPFVNVDQIGLPRVLVNAFVLLLVFLFTAFIFVFLGKVLSKRINK